MALRSYPAEPVYQAPEKKPALLYLARMGYHQAMSLAIERATAPAPDACMLITELEAELSAIYSAEQRHGLSVERVFQQPNLLFFIARLSGQAVGCGGIALADGYGEVKRMYVRAAVRGRGIAQAIIARLEQEARSAGMNLLVLETGDAQHSAIRLYEKAGFKRCGAFGEYATMPRDAIRRSVFFEKAIA
jgi:putative acetyltransferase